jgi:hypothetical protein
MGHKIAFFADAHLGNHKRMGGPVACGMNQRCALAVEVLRRAAARARDVGVAAFVSCGDLFDTSRPPPQLIKAVLDILEGLHASGVKNVLLVGNHERDSDALGDHALGPLDPYAAVVEVPSVITVAPGVDVFCLPHRKARAGAWIEDELEQVADAAPGGRGRYRVLVMHAGIVDAHTRAFLRGAGTADVELLQRACAAVGIQRAFAGDHHNHRRWAMGRITQLGALVPTGFDNPGLDGYGTLAVLDCSTGDVAIEHLPGPRFLTAGTWDLGEVRRVKADTHALYVEVEDTPDADAWVVRLKAERLIVDGDVAAASEEPAADARAGAEEAHRRAADVGAALAEFVSRMPLPEGVDPARVLTIAREHVEAARRAMA